jgi:hypothetical protein
MTVLPPRLAELGDELERAAELDLAHGRPPAPASTRPAARRQRRRLTPRRLLLAAALAVVVIPGAAIAADRLLVDEADVAASMPAGTLALAGTNPTCTVVRENVEFHCVLEKAPAPEVEDWKGTVEPTVDATSHVNGGCRSLNSEGTEWSCYLGQEAVDQQIIGQGFLGELSSGPGVG